MATEVALRLLEQYVGKYVVGLEGNRLRIALWRGEVDARESGRGALVRYLSPP